MTSRGTPEMNNMIAHILMAGFMVWIIVQVEKDGRVYGYLGGYQFATRPHCAKYIFKKGLPDHFRCVEVPYQRK